MKPVRRVTQVFSERQTKLLYLMLLLVKATQCISYWYHFINMTCSALNIRIFICQKMSSSSYISQHTQSLKRRVHGCAERFMYVYVHQTRFTDVEFCYFIGLVIYYSDRCMVTITAGLPLSFHLLLHEPFEQTQDMKMKSYKACE